MNQNQKFIDPPKHAFDLRQQKHLTKRVNGLLNGLIVDSSGNVIGQVLYADGNTIWQMAGAGSALKMFKISSIPVGSKDYFLAKTWDGTNLGSTEIKIAKAVYQRPSITAVTILGVGVTYTYDDDNHRTSIDGINPDQLEECYPPFEVDDGETLGIIYAAQVLNGTGVTDDDDKAVTWLDTTARVWAQYG